jgi:hypothetical protein
MTDCLRRLRLMRAFTLLSLVFSLATGGPNRLALAAGGPGSILGTLKLASGLNGGPALADGVQFGIAVAKIGDLNGDGVADLAIGAPVDGTGGVQRGAVYVH